MNIFLKLFLTFFKIGAFTFGGGYAMIPLIQIEVVDKNNWLNNDEFLDIIAVSQSAPGPIAVNSSVFIGYKLKGFLGAAACALGVILPSFIIILIIAMFLYDFRDNQIIDKMFHGIRPAVAALIFSAVIKLSKTSKIKASTVIIALLSLVTILFLNLHPIIVILMGGVGAILYYKVQELNSKRN